MSSRNLRKLVGPTTLPPPDGSSDEEYEPLYAKHPNKSQYDGLVLSSSSESEHQSSEEAPPVPVEEKKKNKKNNKKRNKAKGRKKSSEGIQMDEIEKSLMEVNALLGEPVEKVESSSQQPVVHPFQLHFAVQYKHLCVTNELNRLFGPDSPDEDTARKRGRKPNLRRIHRESIIPKEFMFPKKGGLSMSIQRRDENFTYFTFDHSRDYQRRHKEYNIRSLMPRRSGVFPLDDQGTSTYVELLIEQADYLFDIDDYTNANALVERIIAYMQHVALPSFNLSNAKTRLEYKYLENRVFHIALLKYMYLLTNKACHRTALEIAKLLLNLDPTDPLAVLFILDTVALRAREHQWLIETLDFLFMERQAGYMFNTQYSYALAKFHVLQKNKGDITLADNLLMTAMLKFPTFVLEFYNCAKMKPKDEILASPLFNSCANETTSRSLKELIHVYTTFTCSKWREPPVYEWFSRVACTLAEKYETCSSIKEQAKYDADTRMSLFRGWPEEILRHLSIISPMSNLIVDGEIPEIMATQSYDPFPPRQFIDRYGYNLVADDPQDTNNSIWSYLITSILPQYDFMQRNME